MSKTFDKTVEYLIYASLVLIPLVFLPFTGAHFATPKLYLFRIITLLIVFFWVLKGETRVRKTPFALFLLLYALVCVITTVFSTNIFSSIVGTYGRFIGLVTTLNLLLWVYIVIGSLDTKKKIKTAMAVSVLTACLVALYGVLQYFGFLHFNWSQDPSGRMFSVIGHSNHVAAYLGMNLMLLIGICATFPFSWRKVLLHLAGILLFAAIVLTASRGGIAATVLALLIWGIYALRKIGVRKYFMKYGRIFLFVFVVLFLAAAVFRGPLGELNIVGRSRETIESIREGHVPDRVSWWMSTVEMVKDKPLLGHGLSTYRDVYNQYRRTDYTLPDGSQDYITPESAHMEYLNILAQQGAVGLFVYLLMIASLFYYAIRHIKKQKKQDIVALSLLFAVIVYLLQVFVSFGVVTTLFLFYTTAGLLISYVELERKDKYIDLKIPLIIKRVLSVAIIALLSFGAVYSLGFLTADYHYRQAKAFEAKRDYKKTIESYEKAIRYTPCVAKYYEEFAGFTFRLGIRMPDASQKTYMYDAANLYREAIELAPANPELHAGLGLVTSRLAVLNIDNEKWDFYKEYALQSWSQAVELGVNNPLHRYNYARQLIFFDSKEEAAYQLEKVLEVRPGYKDAAELMQKVIDSF